MKKMLTRAFICMTPWVLGACEKELVSDAPVITDSSLSIITRSVNAEETVSFPINVFVFNNEDKAFIKKENLSDKDNPLELNLPFGSYDVYAIGGADGNLYDFPTEEEITEESEITLKNGKEHADLMTAHDVITLEEKDGNQLTLSMERQVTELTQATIKQVPEDVTEVSISLSSNYRSIQINGELGSLWDHGYALNDNGDGTWSLPSPTMLLLDSEKATITISLTKDDGTIKNYSYSCTEEIKKNHKISITATYQEDNIVQLTGVITGTTWAGSQEIVFDFGEGNSSHENGNNNNEDDDIINAAAPKEYTLYKDCFVLKVTPNDKGYKEVLLLYNEDFNIETKNKTEDAILQEINAELESTTINEISGWRLPNEDEAKITRNIIGHILNSELKTKPNTNFYFYLDKNDLKAFDRNVDKREYTYAHQYRPVTILKFNK